MKRALIAAAVVAVVAVIVWASVSSSEGRGAQVEVEPAGHRTVVATVKATGEINPKVKVEIQSKVIGEIVSLPVKEGDRVEAGQVVLQIEKDTYVAAVNQARAMLDQAKVNLERARAEAANAEVSLGRAQKLSGDGVISQDQLDQAALAARTAEVAVRAQEQAIEQARSAYQKTLDDLARTTIRSPIDGSVTALNVERGETAVMGTMNFAGSVLMVIGDLSEMLAEVEVGESEVVSLKVGQEATVNLDALPDEPMQGRVVEIGSSGVKTGDVVKFRVKVALESPDARVKPGMTAKVEIVTDKAEDVLAVPQQAVQTRYLDAAGQEVPFREGDTSQREVSAVYVFDDGRALRQEVETGVHDELWVEIIKGLDEGEPVITGPYRTLRGLRAGDDVRREEAGRAGEDDGGADRDS